LSYTKFITRELTSLAVGYAAVLVVVQLWVMSRGPAAYERFLTILASPAVVAFHILVFLLILFHTVTWLNLAPQALVVRLGGRRVPDRVVLAGHYVAWLVATAVVAGYLLWGVS
jgi:fumarate reductase subunit C